MTSGSHPNIITGLPVNIPDVQCNCKCTVVKRICLGCYDFFCTACYETHRAEVSERFNYEINEKDLIIGAIRSRGSADKNAYHFDPFVIRNSINEALQRCQTRENVAVRNAFKALRKFVNKRHDEIMEQIEPISIKSKSTKDVQNEIVKCFVDYEKLLQRKNNELEKKCQAKVASVIDRIDSIDWDHLIDVKSHTNHSQMTVDYTSLTRSPDCRIEGQEQGRVLAASDHLVIYTRYAELIIIEPGENYSIVIPMCQIKNVTPTIVDICWSSVIGVFIILTEKYVFELCHNLKKLKSLENIQPHNGASFRSCTCSKRTLLVSYEGSCLIDEWRYSNDEKWQYVKQWNWASTKDPLKCEIRCIRYSYTGLSVGCAFSYERRSDLFEIHNAETMQCIKSIAIPARPSCGFVGLLDNRWIITVRDWHIIFRVSENEEPMKEINTAQLGQTSVLNISLLSYGTVAIRTQRTLVFFNLL